MIDTLELLEELKETFEPLQAERLARLLARIYKDIANTVTKEEFKELTEVVKRLGERIDRLAEAQEKTEQRVNELAEAQRKTEESVNELAEAQKRTEERLTRLEKVVEELAEAQKRTEERLNELAEAQKRTEERLNELAEAQKRTEERLNELAEAQKKRTEEELRELIGEHRKTREQLGNLSHTVGYVLEDRAYRGLPELLKRDFGIELIEPLKRDYIEIGRDQYEEVNIIGKARKDGKEIWIIGECKSQLKKVDIDEFLKSIKRIEDFLKGEKLLIAVTYQTSPKVRRYVEEKGIKLYFSYEMPLS
jgi:HD-GYP domain-containing protein (c-di-GMP phosphodiesterase class II)